MSDILVLYNYDPDSKNFRSSARMIKPEIYTWPEYNIISQKPISGNIENRNLLNKNFEYLDLEWKTAVQEDILTVWRSILQYENTTLYIALNIFDYFNPASFTTRELIPENSYVIKINTSSSVLIGSYFIDSGNNKYLVIGKNYDTGTTEFIIDKPLAESIPINTYKKFLYPYGGEYQIKNISFPKQRANKNDTGWKRGSLRVELERKI